MHFNWAKRKFPISAKWKGMWRMEKTGKQAGASNDSTEYLLGNPVNRERLLRAVSDLKNSKQNIHERSLIEE
ncbi:hypothetical protein [Dyadobacter bucti]|uniref:hypothetical protein n=1 Tax=Dyadobacter bucti TaxID=2572203 RepID=UPI001109BB7F|nr:hypothetical protein [Dyadobacter bucti]